MSTDVEYYADAVQAAILVAVGVDDLLKASGTLGVVTRERLPAIKGELLLSDATMPYLGVVVTPAGIGSGFSGAVAPELEIFAICCERYKVPETARNLVIKMAARVASILLGFNGTVPSGSNIMTLVSDPKISEPAIDTDDPLLISVTIKVLASGIYY